MKVNQLILAFLFLAVAFQLPAQQPVTNATTIPNWVTNDTSAKNSVDTNKTSLDPFVKAIFAIIEENEHFNFAATKAKADKGDAKAQYDIGYAYHAGHGVAEDATEAVKWYRKAAGQGYISAEASLGFAYKDGRGIPMNYVEAYKWFNLAAAGNDSVAKFAASQRDELVQQMTSDQIAEAQQLSRRFRVRIEGVSTSSDLPTASGSGFFITDDGYLISNYHVVKDATKVRLVTSAGLIDAKVVKVDAANDLALLKADGRFAPLPIASSRPVKLGGMVATVGFPNTGMQGFAPKFARGEIASLSGAADDARYFQISVPVQPGNSGGALVDEHGDVVGVVSAKLNAAAALAASGALPENVNYAVKSSFLLSFLESVPDVANKLKDAVSAEMKFDEVVQSAQAAAVLVLVY